MTYEVDFERANRIWPGEPRLETVEDLFSVTVDVDGTPRKHATHLFDGPIRLIPYQDPRAAADGVDAIAACFPPGSVGFAIKHRRTQHRLLRARPADAPRLANLAHVPAEYTQHIKLQDIHVAAVLGVARPGHNAGAIVPVSAPTYYPDELFYQRKYPMIFVRPVFPSLHAPDRQQHHLDNMQTMVVCFALVSRATPHYNEQNLPATTPEEIALWTAMMIRALAGEHTGRAFFRQKQNSLYCGEFVYIAACASVAWPLCNKTTCEPLVGGSTWRAFEAAIDAHNARSTTAAAERRGRNGAQLLQVPLKLAPEDLPPLGNLATTPLPTSLAFQPMPLVDLIESFIRAYWPREHDGEQTGVLQAHVIEALVPAFSGLSARGATALSPADQLEYAQLVREVVTTVAAAHPSYAAFQDALAGVRQRVADFLARHGQQHLAIPPSLFHLVAQGKYPGGALGLEYVGHGIHRNLLRPRSA